MIIWTIEYRTYLSPATCKILGYPQEDAGYSKAVYKSNIKAETKHDAVEKLRTLRHGELMEAKIEDVYERGKKQK